MPTRGKFVPYRSSNLPALPGNEIQYTKRELTKIEQSINALISSLTIVEKAGAPVANDVPEGTWRVIHDTTGSTVGLYANIGGTLKSVLLT